jgi:L-fuculokinase
MKQKVTLIFDIGKTNKKYFLFDENFIQVKSAYTQITEINDDDGFACDNLAAIEKWMFEIYEEVSSSKDYEISTINFSAYGATMVHLNESGKPCTPLYNYLKAIPEDIFQLFAQKYGDWAIWSQQTASPFLGMLNAGLQLFWLKYSKPALFNNIKNSVFLPQYLSYRFTNKLITEFTGVGCHTGMWDFKKKDFHLWMYAEGFTKLLPAMYGAGESFLIPGTNIMCGTGIHDSSAALIPYIRNNNNPFILLSTGTWSICLNPFNDELLTAEELEEDCLCYFQPNGKPVKASRFFMGNEFSKWVHVLNKHFNVAAHYHKTVEFDAALHAKANAINDLIFTYDIVYKNNLLSNQLQEVNLSGFANYEEAYHQLIKELLLIQVQKIKLVTNKKIETIYVDGGFANNKVFIVMLQHMLPGFSVIPSEMPLGTALGAAMMMAGNTINTATGLPAQMNL